MNTYIVQPVRNLMTNVGSWIDNTIFHPIGDAFESAFNWVGNALNNFVLIPTAGLLEMGAPWVDPNAKGMGKNGEYTLWQKIMGVVAGVGFVAIGIGACFIPFPGARVIGVRIILIGAAVMSTALGLALLGGAEGN